MSKTKVFEHPKNCEAIFQGSNWDERKKYHSKMEDLKPNWNKINFINLQREVI